MAKFTAEEIKAHTKITAWELRRCSICGTPLHYLFNDDDVRYDSNCDCTTYWDPPRKSSWEDVADTVSRQNDEVQKRMLAQLAGETV